MTKRNDIRTIFLVNNKKIDILSESFQAADNKTAAFAWNGCEYS